MERVICEELRMKMVDWKVLERLYMRKPRPIEL